MHTWQGQPQQNSFHRLLRRWGGVLGGGRENLYRTGPYQCFPSNRALVAAQAFLQTKERQETSYNLACFLAGAVCERPRRLIGNYDSKKHNQLSWRGPKRPTPVLHLQLTTWSLLLVTVCKALTDVLVPAGFLTPYSTDKTDRMIAQVGKQSQSHTQQLTDTLQSSRQLPRRVAHYRMIQAGTNVNPMQRLI